MTVVKLKSRSGKIKNLPAELTVGEFDTAAEVKELISEETNIPVERLNIAIPLADRGSKAATGPKTSFQVVKDNEQIGNYSPELILVKDLGPQISWRLVYFIEYLAPLIIHPLVFIFSDKIYGEQFQYSANQVLVFGLIMAHFFKREFETLLVHKFSKATMPLKNLFRNSFYYAVFSGINLSIFLYAPESWKYSSNPWKKYLFGSLFELPKFVPQLIAVFWLIAELSNFRTHVILSDLRTPGSSRRYIPHGFAFEYVSCPNYFFETMSWLAIALITQNWASYLFLIVGTAQMFQWAVQRHKRYHQEFKSYPKDRKIYFPFLL